MTAPLLSVRDLKVQFLLEDAVVRAVDGVSFDVHKGETVGVVGESGCGKSVTALSIMGLLPTRGVRVAGGSVRLEGDELVGRDEEYMRGLRGQRMAMIFQEPMTSLNPLMTVGHQISEAVRIHEGVSKSQARARALEMLRLVQIPEPKSRLDSYPHQFSGGMRQRVMIAMGLVCNPKLLIADEPTTALDVTIQAQILDLVRSLKDRTGTSVILITHDLGVVAETCQRVIVMYAGRKVEEATVEELFDRPAHPYTRGLMASMPRLGGRGHKRLTEIPGVVPSLREEIVGCAFAPRCPHATALCRTETPEIRDVGAGHLAACHHASEVMPG